MTGARGVHDVALHDPVMRDEPDTEIASAHEPLEILEVCAILSDRADSVEGCRANGGRAEVCDDLAVPIVAEDMVIEQSLISGFGPGAAEKNLNVITMI